MGNLGQHNGTLVGAVGHSAFFPQEGHWTNIGLLPPHFQAIGRAWLGGELDLLQLSEEEIRALRGRRIVLIPQGGMTYLNPVFTIGYQIDEALRRVGVVAPRARRAKMLELTMAPAAGSAPAQPTAAPVPTRVPVLRLVGGADWGYPSPFGFNRGLGYTRASYIFDTLVWRDGSGQTIPWLATEWQVSDDQLTWTFTLRDGVKWHDGQPLTVEDVIFSYQYFATIGSGWFLAPLSDDARDH